jgi:hypothetical protein
MKCIIGFTANKTYCQSQSSLEISPSWMEDFFKVSREEGPELGSFHSKDYAFYTTHTRSKCSRFEN